MSKTDLVDLLFREHRDLLEYLYENHEVSFASALQATIPKVILLAGASFLETEVQRVVIEFFEEKSAANLEAVAFVRNKAIKRQYHTYFDWDHGKAHSFFGLFGEDCKDRFKGALSSDADFALSVKDFCRLGSLRNQLVHGNYASFVIDQTAEEVFEMYRSAATFVERIPDLLRGKRSDSGKEPRPA